jgi:hypothetical protein
MHHHDGTTYWLATLIEGGLLAYEFYDGSSSAGEFEWSHLPVMIRDGVAGVGISYVLIAALGRASGPLWEESRVTCSPDQKREANCRW